MRILKGCTEFHIEEETAVAIGKFDGVHIGHRKLISEILEKKKEGLSACVFTFDPPPDVLFGQRPPMELTTKEEKRILFERMGVDILIEFPLNLQTAAILPEQFVKEILSKQMRAGFVAAGSDLSFGRGGEGDSALLCRMQKECGFQVQIIDKICREGREVSSTYVREAVREGRMELVRELLGSPYSISGEIVHGNKLGRRIGMPTINQLPSANKVLPPFGVYFSEVELEGSVYKGITNIGKKPTVSREEQIGVETFLYNFNQDVYGDFAQVRLFSFRRPEKKFADVQALKRQIREDIEAGLSFRGQ